jgi:hypothetical protein
MNILECLLHPVRTMGEHSKYIKARARAQKECIRQAGLIAYSEANELADQFRGQEEVPVEVLRAISHDREVARDAGFGRRPLRNPHLIR